MKNTLEIYVEGTRLDLFKDESITIKTSSKDFKDIDKIFTSFSRKLTIPASKVNNRIFKHYSNSAIVSGGFDARSLKRAEIKLNGNTLEKGKVSLESVKKRNGEIDSYSIRFYGALTEFKKRLGEDYIHNVDTSEDNISNPSYTGLMTTPLSILPAVVMPISSTQNRFIYHSTDSDYAYTQGFEKTKNIAYVDATRTNQYGVTEDELVGAYRVGHMLDHIATKYNLNLTGAINAPYIQNYRILLNSAGRENRDSSLILYNPDDYPLTENTYDLPSIRYADYEESDTIVSTTPLISTTDTRLAEVNHSEYGDTTLRLTENFRTYFAVSQGITCYNQNNFNQFFPQYLTSRIDCQLRVYVSTALTNFEVKILKNGEEIGTITESSSAGDDKFIYNTNSANDSGDITFQVNAAGTGTVNIYYRVGIINLVFNKGTNQVPNENEHYTGYDSFSVSATATGENGYIINSYLPKMKVKDFFGVLIKQFNLIPTVTLNDNGTHEINFKHYDYYLNQGTTRDITKYVDISSEEIAPSNLYSGLSFSHKDPVTAMEDAYFQVNRRKYGSLEYEYEEDGEKLSGSLFEFKIPTHRIPLERLEDISTGNMSQQVWMQLTDINTNSTNIGATFCYCTNGVYGGDTIAYDNGSTVQQISQPIQASNVYYTPQSYNSHLASVGNYWGGELNEFYGNEVFQGLGNFNIFWYNYTRIMFDERTRKVSLSAFLPEGVLINLTPADTLIIGDRTFLIESYSTDYGTGKTNLELMEVQKTILDEFQSNQITATIPSGTTSYALVYMSMATGQIVASNYSTVNCIGSVKWINLV